MPQSSFKEGGEVLASELTKLLGPIWERKQIPKNWSESVIVFIYQKCDRSPCENRRGFISLILSSDYLVPPKNVGVRNKLVSDHCIDETITLRQIPVHKHNFCRPMNYAFLGQKARFNSLNEVILWCCLSLKDVPEKSTSTEKSLFQQSKCSFCFRQSCMDSPPEVMFVTAAPLHTFPPTLSRVKIEITVSPWE